MKKVFIYVLFVFAVLSFCSCGSSTKEANNVTVLQNSSVKIASVHVQYTGGSAGVVNADSSAIAKGESLSFYMPVTGNASVVVEAYDEEDYMIANGTFSFDFGDKGKNILKLTISGDNEEGLKITEQTSN